MIDKSGTVKVIDFGIGKLIEPAQADDSLRSQINRRNADRATIHHLAFLCIFFEAVV